MAFSLESDKPIKYVSAEGKYYTLDNPGGSARPTLAETSLDEIRGRMGDKPAGFDFNQALQGLKNEGALKEAPSLAELRNAAIKQGYGVPGSFGQPEGSIPQSKEFSNYLDSTGQTYNPRIGFSGTPGQLNNNAQSVDKINEPSPSNYEQAFNQYNSQAGAVKEIADAGTARGIVNQYASPQYDGSQADVVLASNQAHQQYLNNFTQAQTSRNQTQGLTQLYTSMSQQMGIPALNVQLLNMKNVMDGTEDDIRKEIMASGSGFATNSQVLALTAARNKSLIQNYNNLLRTRDDMQKNLNFMIGLSEKDRTYASQRIDQQLKFDEQQQVYADKMQKNARDAFDNVKNSIGWEGILKLTQGNPLAVKLIENSYGLPSGGLELAAQREKNIETQKQLKANLDNSKIQAQINKINTGGEGKNKGVSGTTGIGIPTALTPYLRSSSNGTSYVYLGDLSPNSKEKYANIASANNLKVIMDKNVGNDLNNIKDANAKLDTIGGIMDHLTSPGALSRFLYGVGASKFASFFQTNPEKAAAGTLNDVALDLLKAISGVQGFRGNQTAVQQVRDNLPSIYDTKDVSRTKIDFVRKLITDRENALVGPNNASSKLNQSSQDILKKYGIQ